MGMGSRYPPPHPAPPHHGGGTALQNPAQYLSNSQPNSTMNQLGGQMVRMGSLALKTWIFLFCV